MAILKAAGYTAPKKTVAVPKAPTVASVPKTSFVSGVGYGGSSWNYPTAGLGVKSPLVSYSTTPGVKPYVPSLGLPLSAAYPASNPVTQTTPADTGPTAAVPRSAVPGNYTASYADIMSNPMSMDALGQYNTNMQTLMRALRGNIGGYITKSGYDPTAAFQQLMASRPDLGDFSDLVDPAAIAAGNQNPLSERAVAEQNYNKSMAGLDYGLAARGIEGSGAQATGGNEILQSRQMAENQSRQSLLDAIQTGIGGYLDKKASGYNQLQDVYSQVAQMLANQQGAVPETGTADLTDQENAGVVPEPGTNVPSAATRPTNYIEWGGKQIANVTQMKQWLAQHGQNWNTWAQRYPAAARQLAGLS